MAKPSFVRTLSEVTQRKTVKKELLGKNGKTYLANPDGSDVEATLDFATREYTIIKQVAAPGKGKMSYLLH